MKRVILAVALAAAPVLAVAQEQTQNQNGQLPSETACNAVRERVQLSLAQADRGLQSEDHDQVQRWAAIAANYAQVYASFCETPAAE